MANDPEEKQPSASPKKEEPSAVNPSAAASEPASKPPATPAVPAAKPPAAAAPPRPPAPPKEGPVALDNDLVKRYKERFDWLSDLTAVDWPKREQRFDVVLNMYSLEKNERLRLKVYATADERVPSVQGVWATANWEEREVYDMFGVVFEGHPELKRILLPDEWQGHPLRKDYDILTQDTAWVRENLGIESGQ